MTITFIFVGTATAASSRNVGTASVPDIPFAANMAFLRMDAKSFPATGLKSREYNRQ